MKLSGLLETEAPAATLLVRLMVGGVFLSEGIQKFLYPDAVGAGRFARIGLASPEFLAPFVGGTEAVFGAMILAGLCTRLATVPLIVVIGTALITTEIPILPDKGFWSMAHESRTDCAMLLGLLFLLIVGAGRVSIDARLASPKRRS